MKNKYRTYTNKPLQKSLFYEVQNSFHNKPYFGLWACEGNEWEQWCHDNDMDIGSIVTEFELSEDCNIYVIDKPDDMIKLIKDFTYKDDICNMQSIDWIKLSELYDGVKLTLQGLFSCRFLPYTITSEPCTNVAYSMGTCSWDVPSICIFNFDKITNIRQLRKVDL